MADRKQSPLRGPAFAVASVLIGGLAATLSEWERLILWLVAAACLFFGVFDIGRSWAAEKAYFSNLFKRAKADVEGLDDTSRVRPISVPQGFANLVFFWVSSAVASVVFGLAIVWAASVMWKLYFAAPPGPSATVIADQVRHAVRARLRAHPEEIRKPDEFMRAEAPAPKPCLEGFRWKPIVESMKGLNGLQAQAVANLYLGRCLSVRGTFRDEQLMPAGGVILVRFQKPTTNAGDVYMMFNSDSKDSLLTLVSGDAMKVTGIISSLGARGVTLTDCKRL